MNISRAQLNAQNSALLAKFKSLASQAPTEFSFATELTPKIEAAVAAVKLDESPETETVDLDKLAELSAKLKNYVSRICEAYKAMMDLEERPEWCKNFRKKQIDFYAEFFTQLKSKTAAQAKAAALTEVQFAAANAWHTKWAAEIVKLGDDELANQIEKAIDLRYFLGGALRLIGVPQVEVDYILRKVVKG